MVDVERLEKRVEALEQALAAALGKQAQPSKTAQTPTRRIG
jgi:hypothetical protein